MDREDGEMSDDNSMQVDDDKKETPQNDDDKAMIYLADKHGIMIRKLEKVDSAKLEERAKRFGISLTGSNVVTQKQIDELYENFGIESGNERHFRFDSVHLSGIDGLTSKEIFQYLEDYKPLSLERIDNISCNVVCQDHISAALALLVHSSEIEDKNLKKMLAEKSDYHWREGLPFKDNLIFMRFATNGDKKIVKKKSQHKTPYDYYNDDNLDSINKNPWGDLCKSWGVYDHQEVFHRKVVNDFDYDEEEPDRVFPIQNKRLAMRLGKRSHNNVHESDEDSGSDSEWRMKSKTPRMRMHADDEEKKLKKKQISVIPKEEYGEQYAPLSIEIVNSHTDYKQRELTKLSDKFKYHNTNENKSNVLSRLGDKVLPVDEVSDASTSDSDCNVMSKVQKVKSASSSAPSIWSRLKLNDSSSTDAGGQSDLRHILKSRKHKSSANTHDKGRTEDLRERLSKAKHSNLRIEIDNRR